MSALTLLLTLCFTSLVILMPIVVGILAFRRLTKSTSSNAWVYAVTCLFATVTTAGLLPWALGISVSSWIFFVLAAFCPAIWLAVTAICDVSRTHSCEEPSADFPTILFKAHKKPSTPLLLNDPIVDLPILFFSHRAPANVDAPSMKKAPALTSGPEIKCGSDVAAKTHSARYVEPEPIGEKSVLEVAREMRRNTSTEKRRPKLLPAPSISELPFIKPSGTTA